MTRKAIVITDPVSAGLAIRDIAKEKGYTVIGYLSMDFDFYVNLPRSYRPPFIDDPNYLDLIVSEKDFEKGLMSLRDLDYEIVGVIAGADLGLASADFLSDKLGVVCNDPALVNARRDKLAMKNAIKEAGLRTMKYSSCSTLQELHEFTGKNSYPIVLKPSMGVGMSNVFICSTLEEAEEAFEKTIDSDNWVNTRCETVDVEEFIDGTEFSGDTFSFDGKTIVTDLWQYNRVDTPAGKRLYRDIFMLPIDDPQYDEIKQYCIGITNAVGVRYGASHPEIIVDNNGPVVMEVNTRHAGCHMSHLCRDLSNFDPLSSHLEVMVGNTIDLPEAITYSGYAWIAFCPTMASGKISTIEGLDEIRRLPSFKEELLVYKEGEVITPTVNLMTNPYIAWLVHEDREQLRKDAERVHQLFSVVCSK